MKSISSLIYIVKTSLKLITEHMRRMKDIKKREEFDEIVKNPEKHHSDKFGKSSGVVRIDTTKRSK